MLDEELWGFENLGRCLVSIRIAKVMSQEDLAYRLPGVSLAKLKHAEETLYCKASLEFIQQVVEALDAEFLTTLESLGF